MFVGGAPEELKELEEGELLEGGTTEAVLLVGVVTSELTVVGGAAATGVLGSDGGGPETTRFMGFGLMRAAIGLP